MDTKVKNLDMKAALLRKKIKTLLLEFESDDYRVVNIYLNKFYDDTEDKMDIEVVTLISVDFKTTPCHNCNATQRNDFKGANHS